MIDNTITDSSHSPSASTGCTETLAASKKAGRRSLHGEGEGVEQILSPESPAEETAGGGLALLELSGT